MSQEKEIDRDATEISKTQTVCSEGDNGGEKRHTSRQLIEQNLEEMIAEMNAKRTRDHTLLQNLKKELQEWCSSAHAAVEAALYEKTVKSSECIDHKLTELVEALGRITKLEVEMEQFRQQLGAFCVNVQ